MSNEVTCHFKLLTKHNPDDMMEPRRYSCSECDEDIFNTNLHAQFSHDTLVFDIDGEEEARTQATPSVACGIMGCTFDANHTGLHSWAASEGSGNHEPAVVG